jgi:hypothetical protein
MNNLISSIQQTLEELNCVLRLMSDKQFSTPLRIFSDSSVGMHARHIVEFYQCLLSQSAENQIINYDKRQRDLQLQTNLDYFTLTINSIIAQLENLDKETLNTPLPIVSGCTISTTSDDDGENAAHINSSLGRELHYNLEHTIHHAAFIKIGILSLLPDAYLPKTFGVAPSTIRYNLMMRDE